MILHQEYVKTLVSKLLGIYSDHWPIDDEYVIGNKDYDRIADIVKKDLQKKLKKLPVNEKIRIGVTISPSTIERILTGTYKIGFLKNGAINTESEKILNKVALFLNYRNWYDYINKIEAEKNSNSPAAAPMSVVRDAALATFDMIETHNPITLKKLRQFYDEDSLGLRYLLDEIEAIRERNITAKFEAATIFTDSIILTDKQAVVRTIEDFKVVLSKKTKKGKRITMQIQRIYILNYLQGKWKIVERHLSHHHYYSPFLTKFLSYQTMSGSNIE